MMTQIGFIKPDSGILKNNFVTQIVGAKGL